MGYIAGSLRIAQAYNISQYTPIYSNILLFRPGISSGIYWNILEYIGDVSTGPIYRNISQYIPLFSNISGLVYCDILAYIPHFSCEPYCQYSLRGVCILSMYSLGPRGPTRYGYARRESSEASYARRSRMARFTPSSPKRW